jgi:hypothetical protein
MWSALTRSPSIRTARTNRYARVGSIGRWRHVPYRHPTRGPGNVLPRVAPAGQVSGDVHHRPFGFSGIFIVTVRSRLRPFLSRPGGDSSVPHAARGPNRPILSGIASEDRLAPTARSANITWSRDVDEVFGSPGARRARMAAVACTGSVCGLASGWHSRLERPRAAPAAGCRTTCRTRGPLNTACLLCVLVVDRDFTGAPWRSRSAGAVPQQ